MAATIAAEEVFAIPNALFASEIMDAAADVLSPVFEEIIGDSVVDSVVDVLTELGVDSAAELLVGEALNTITGGVLGTLAGLTYSAYRCGAFWIAPTARSAVALVAGMLGGLSASMVLTYVWQIGVVALLFDDGGIDDVTEQGVDGQADSVENIFSVAWIGSTVFGAIGAFFGRWNAIKLSNKCMDKYFPPKLVKSKKE